MVEEGSRIQSGALMFQPRMMKGLRKLPSPPLTPFALVKSPLPTITMGGCNWNVCPVTVVLYRRNVDSEMMANRINEIRRTLGFNGFRQVSTFSATSWVCSCADQTT